MRKIYVFLKYILRRVFILFFIIIGFFSFIQEGKVCCQEDIENRKESLNRLIPLLDLDKDEMYSDPRIWIEYQSWREWIEKSGELPPNFDTMPSNAELPDPLIREENGRIQSAY